ALFSESVAWTFQVKNAGGTVLDEETGTGKELSLTWDGLVGGHAVADGTYTWTLRGADAWENGVASGTGSIVVDTAGPSIASMSPDAPTINQLSPNGDGVADTIATTVTPSEAGTLSVRVADSDNTTVRTFSVSTTGGATAVTWDGKGNGGATLV